MQLAQIAHYDFVDLALLTVVRTMCYDAVRSNETLQNRRHGLPGTINHIFFTRRRNAHYGKRKEGKT